MAVGHEAAPLQFVEEIRHRTNRITISVDGGDSRRAVLQAAVAAGVGAMTGAGSYGFLYERHRSRGHDAHLARRLGLPPALNGLRIGLLTDVHRSRWVSPTMCTPRWPPSGRAAGPHRARRRLRHLGRSPLRRTGRPKRSVRSPRRTASSHPRQPRRRSRHAGGARAQRRAGPEGRAHAHRRPRRGDRVDRHPLLDEAGRRDRTPGQRCHGRCRSSSRTTPAASPKRRRSTSRWCSRGTRTGGRWCCRSSAQSPRGSSLSSEGIARTGPTTMFVSRGFGTIYVPVRINCPPEVAVLTLRGREPLTG